MSHRIQLLRTLQARAFRESRWHSLLGALERVTDEQFSHVPEFHKGFPWMDGSIRSIVYHVAGDTLVQCSAAFGDGSVTWDTLKIPKESREQMIESLTRSHEVVARHLESESEATLDRKVKNNLGEEMTAEEMYIMLIEHDLYHAGQIRIMRNILDGKR